MKGTFFTFFLFVNTLVFAQKFKTTEKEMYHYLEVLTSDSCAGRYTGDEGQKKAAKYIANHFRKNGLTDPTNTNTYFQQYELQAIKWDSAIVYASRNTFKLGKDFYIYGNIGLAPNIDLEIVWAGFGIDLPKYNSYENLQVKDKIVMIQLGEPLDSVGNYVISGSKKTYPEANDWKLKVSTAMKKGAKGVMLVTAPCLPEFNRRLEAYNHHQQRPRMSLPSTLKNQELAIIISPQMASDLLGIDTLTYNLKHKKYHTSSTLLDKASFKFSFQIQKIQSENVIGMIKGKTKPDEYVFLSAHYDHLGVVDGKIYRGADDDATGVAALMAISKAMQKKKNKPERSVVFIAFSGEEHGLLGSEYYASNPVLPLSNTVVDLNIDMIGRVDKAHEKDTNFVYIIGDDKLSSDLRPISENMNKKHSQLNLDYTFNSDSDPNRFYYRSDHYNFAKNRIPIIFYFNGVHADYHKPTDTLDKIILPKVHKITKLVFYTALEIANREMRILVDKK